jgi:diacylglycerol O-acyltransferase / wax synthase
MHIGALVRAQGPAPPYEDFLDSIRARLHYVPRYRQRLVYPPASTGRPLWADDTDFNLEYHVRHTALPTPGSDEQLTNLAARVFSQQLDRSKPLWELWIVEHVAGGGWALISKTGLELVEDPQDADLMATLFETSPEVRRLTAPHWEPGPAPTPAQLAASAINDALRPVSALTRARRAIEAAAERALPSPPPETPLNVRTGPHRRLAVVDVRLDDFRVVRDAFGGTVNDVVLAVVAGALRRWLHDRATRAEGLDITAGVPVSVGGDRLAQVDCPLPVDVLDPIERLRAITERMREAAESRGALGAGVIAASGDFAPPTILARAARVGLSTRAHALLVTNVPGPQTPVYMLGRRMERTFPVPALVSGHALAVAVMSYDGGMNFGLLADYDAVPDLDAFTAGLVDSLAELLDLAGSARLYRGAAKTSRTRARARAKRRSSPT